jgi:hypothetical protein
MIIGPLILVYLAIGLAFAVAFVVKGALVIDKSAHETGVIFRLMILPGSILLWPYLLFRWVKMGGHS